MLLTGAEDGDKDAGERLAAALRPYGFTGPGFASRTCTEKPRLIGEGKIRRGKRAIVVSGIARTEPFLDAVRGFGFEIVEHFEFPDHYAYPPASIEKIVDAYMRHGAELVLTTAKDGVKLQGHVEVPLAEIPIRAEPEKGFFAWLDQKLGGLLPGR